MAGQTLIESQCWNCRAAMACEDADAVGVVECARAHMRPLPPGPRRAPSKELSDRLWRNHKTQRADIPELDAESWEAFAAYAARVARGLASLNVQDDRLQAWKDRAAICEDQVKRLREVGG